MLIREPILAEEILIVRDEQEQPGSSVNLLVGCVAAETVFPLGFSNLPEPSEHVQALGHVGLDIVVEQNKRGLPRLTGLPPRQELVAFQCFMSRGGKGSFP